MNKPRRHRCCHYCTYVIYTPVSGPGRFICERTDEDLTDKVDEHSCPMYIQREE